MIGKSVLILMFATFYSVGGVGVNSCHFCKFMRGVDKFYNNQNKKVENVRITTNNCDQFEATLAEAGDSLTVIEFETPVKRIPENNLFPFNYDELIGKFPGLIIITVRNCSKALQERGIKVGPAYSFRRWKIEKRDDNLILKPSELNEDESMELLYKAIAKANKYKK